MMSLRRHRSLLRTALLVLVALGVLMQPILTSLSELHGLEHAVAVHSDHGHSHHDGHDDPPADDDAPGDPIGLHGLMHTCNVAASMTFPEAGLLVTAYVAASDPPDRAHPFGPPDTHLTLPFRPPIA